MATLVLGAVGFAVGSQVGSPLLGMRIGAGLGSVVDALLVNEIFKEPPDGRPPFKGSLNADEGNPAPWVAGPNNRVLGQVIWMRKIKEQLLDGDEKGATESETRYRYTVDIAIAWCRTQTQKIKKIWANGEAIFIADGTVIDITGDDCVVSAVPTNDPADGNTGIVREQIRYTWDEADVTDEFIEKLKFLQTGYDVTISGPTLNSRNAGTFKVVGTGNIQAGPIAKVTLLVLKCKSNEPGCQSGVDQLNQEVNLIQVISGDESPYFKEITPHLGSDSEPQDALIVEDLGSDTPAYRGTTYSVIERLDISKWAGSIPSFEACIEERPTLKLTSLLVGLMARSEGFQSSWWDLNPLLANDVTIQGYQTSGPVPPISPIQHLLALHDVEAQELTTYKPGLKTPQTKLTFTRYLDVEEVQVAAIDTSAREIGSVGRRGPTLVRNDPDSLPTELVLEFFDVDFDFQRSTVSYVLGNEGGVRNQQRMTIDQVMSRTEASEFAKKALWTSVTRHDKVVASLPLSYTRIVEGDRVELLVEGEESTKMRVTQRDVGENGIIEIRGQIDDALQYAQTGDPDDDVEKSPQQVELAPYVTPIIRDLPPLTSYQASNFGITSMIGFGTAFDESPGLGAVIFSTLDDITYTKEGTNYTNAQWGYTETLLPEVSPFYFDSNSTVQVRISHGELFDQDFESVAKGLNWCVIGREIVGFTTALLVETGLYELSGLFRGRRNTEEHMVHTIHDFFVMLQGTQFFDLEIDRYLALNTMRAVPSGRAVEDVDSDYDVDMVPNAETLRPFSLHGFWACRTLDKNMCVYATRRFRLPNRVFSAAAQVDIEGTGPESYTAEIEWSTDSGASFDPVRTITGCLLTNGQIAFGYSRADQIEDADIYGVNNFPTLLKFIIYRTSTSIGEGRRREFCVNSFGVMFDSDCGTPP